MLLENIFESLEGQVFSNMSWCNPESIQSTGQMTKILCLINSNSSLITSKSHWLLQVAITKRQLMNGEIINAMLNTHFPGCRTPGLEEHSSAQEN